jgi:hypothetical protein
MDSKLSDFAAINPAIVAAIIGAVVAIFGIFIRDLIIATLIKKREERIKLLHEKLSNLHSPLMFYLGGPNPQILAIITTDQELRKLVTANFHLLSPCLQQMIGKANSIGEDIDGVRKATIDGTRRLIGLTEDFREVLVKEYEVLRNQYNKIK